jgi:hypothetical protein
MNTRHHAAEIAKDAATYKQLVEFLESFTNKEFVLGVGQNPILRRRDLHPSEYVWALKEYSQFSSEAIHMLIDARLHIHDWPVLAAEIDRNVEEEKGSQTNGIPHLETMRLGYINGMGFDPTKHEPSFATKRFLSTMRHIFRQKNNPHIAGALLAFESVANPEFHAIDELYKQSGAQENADMRAYIDGHKEFEIGHKDGLVKAIEPYITPPRYEEFAAGYLEVCRVMSDWWRELNVALE